MTTRDDRRGFTLIEAMMVVAILGVLFAIGPRLLIQANRFLIMTNARSAIQTEARSAMYVISRELHQAQSSTITIDRLSTHQPYCSRITFTKVQGTTISFYQQGNSLVQRAGNDTTVLTKSLKYLAFTFPRSDDLAIVSVSLTLQRDIFEARTTALHMASERVRVMN
jgi:prepilin-type N-terminal cleavage/methylation domain-containing protein